MCALIREYHLLGFTLVTSVIASFSFLFHLSYVDPCGGFGFLVAAVCFFFFAWWLALHCYCLYVLSVLYFHYLIFAICLAIIIDIVLRDAFGKFALAFGSGGGIIRHDWGTDYLFTPRLFGI